MSRSSSVARAAGPSVVDGSYLLRPGRRARSHSVVVGCGRVPAAAAAVVGGPRSRGRPFRRCGSSTAFFVCVLLRDFVPRCGRFVGAVCVAQLTTPSSALSWSPVSRGDSEISLPAIKQGYYYGSRPARGRPRTRAGPRRLAALRSSLSLSAGLRFSGALQRPRRVVPMNERPAYRVVGATNSNPSLASSAQLLSRVTQLVRPRYTHGRDGTHAEGISPVPRSQRAGGQPSRRAPPPNNQAQGSAVEARQPHHQPTKRYHDA